VADDAVDAAAERIKGIMQSAAELSVPLIVDTGVGDNWDEAH
jgi:DNA polymerase-1